MVDLSRTIKLLTSAAVLAVLVIPAQAASLPKSYHGDWCQTQRVQNGHESNGKRIPTDLTFQRVPNCNDPEDNKLTISGNRLYYDPISCRAIRSKAYPSGWHTVTYRCRNKEESFTSEISFNLDPDGTSLSVEW